MTIAETISKTAASNPTVGLAVARQSVSSAILAGLQTGDTATTSLISAVSTRALEANQLLASAAPHLGQTLNTTV